LSALIRRQSRLDDHPPAPPDSTPPVLVRRPPPARPREPCLAPAARRVQEDGVPPEAPRQRSVLLGLALQGVDRLEDGSRDRGSSHRAAVAAPAFPRILDEALPPAQRGPAARPRRDQGPGRQNGRRESA